MFRQLTSNNFIKAYKHSLNHMLHNLQTLILCMILLALSSLFIIGIPLMSGNDHWTDYYLSVLLATSPTLLTLIPFYSSFVSETNASPGERTFLFSRPITRNVYLWAKLISSYTFTLCVSFLICIMLIIVYILYKQHGNDLNQQGFNLIGFIATVLVLTLFGSSFGTCFRYYIREKFASFIVMVGTLIYTILFSVLGQIYITDHFLFVTLYFNVLPIAIFAPIAIATTVLGFYLMKHSNVDV